MTERDRVIGSVLLRVAPLLGAVLDEMFEDEAEAVRGAVLREMDAAEAMRAAGLAPFGPFAAAVRTVRLACLAAEDSAPVRPLALRALAEMEALLVWLRDAEAHASTP